ncbi:hypothetical protein GcM3_169020 [Golovinomyces cichoracearum]|uniref:Uncharacterized protein n=1 Tax=Golovinomyces cichoracearum TaxID=62708 RepID=A0A420HRM8_9PEZI|nr:hypothetical protein GcM3_169020 [Golovinomyces cichoracearum]
MANRGNEIHIYNAPLIDSSVLIKIGDPLKNADYESLDHLLAEYRGHGVALCAQYKNEEVRVSLECVIWEGRL